MVEPRGIEPLTFAMPLPEEQAGLLIFLAFRLRYRAERSGNMLILRYRCDTVGSVARDLH